MPDYQARHADRDLIRQGWNDSADAVFHREGAESLRQRVEEHFRLDIGGTYARAIDGTGRPCAVRSSNPGHLLCGGAVSEERRASSVKSLASPDPNKGEQRSPRASASCIGVTAPSRGLGLAASPLAVVTSFRPLRSLI